MPQKPWSPDPSWAPEGSMVPSLRNPAERYAIICLSIVRSCEWFQNSIPHQHFGTLSLYYLAQYRHLPVPPFSNYANCNIHHGNQVWVLLVVEAQDEGFIRPEPYRAVPLGGIESLAT